MRWRFQALQDFLRYLAGISSLFSPKTTKRNFILLCLFFEKNIGYIAGRKLEDKKDYDKNLRQTFDDSSD